MVTSLYSITPHASSHQSSMNFFDKESVGSNSSSTATPPPPPPNSLTHARATDPPSITAVAAMNSPQKVTDQCFNCREAGHWARDCPNKTPKNSPSKSPADHGLPVLRCHCGLTGTIQVSRTPANPGRKFYSCPSHAKKHLFKWCDDMKGEDIIVHPICKCDAGPCRIEGKFFVCPIKKGQGACGYIISMDESRKKADEANSSPTSTLTSSHDTGLSPMLSDGDDFALSDELLEAVEFNYDGNVSSPQSTVTCSGNNSPCNSVLVDEGDIADPHGVTPEVISELDQCLVVTPEDAQYTGFISELPRKDILAHDQETSVMRLPRLCKRRRVDAPEVDGLILGFSTDCQEMPPTMEESLSTNAIRVRQLEFRRQIASAEDSSSGDSSTLSSTEATHLPIISMPLSHNYLEPTTIFQTLGFQGWCGRVVYLPSQGLQFAQAKPLYCGVFPNYDPINVPRLTCDELEGSPVGPPLKVSPGSKMAQKVKEIAMKLQDELLSLLETTDFHEHEFLADESSIIVHALEGLSAQYQSFKVTVDGFINKAKSLADVEESIRSDTSNELVEIQKHKKQRLDEVARRHSETLVALDASNRHIEELEKEVTRLRELLAHAEEILDCCRAENGVIRTRFDLISRDKLECERSFEVASIEAEEAVKIRRQKEAELGVAKAEFDEARSKLRQRCDLSCLM